MVEISPQHDDMPYPFLAFHSGQIRLISKESHGASVDAQVRDDSRPFSLSSSWNPQWP